MVGGVSSREVAKVPCSVEIASELGYKEPLLSKNTLFITISQSGETADTLEALKMAKRAGLKSLTICNVDNSSIVRESDISILTRAGIEKGWQAQRHLLPKLWSYGFLLYIWHS